VSEVDIKAYDRFIQLGPLSARLQRTDRVPTASRYRPAASGPTSFRHRFF